MGQEKWYSGYTWDSGIRQLEGGEGVHPGECLRLSFRGDTVMDDSLGSELVKEVRRMEVEVTRVEGVKELGVRVF